jgi:glutamyl-tRNA(Gln) amidotransferase subunit E
MKCGIEIHQRLATQRKLFCDCSASIQAPQQRSVIVRRQRAVAGELGGVDPAALHELLRKRAFSYATAPNSCLVEADCEPPHALNAEALDMALRMCLLLNARIVDEVHVMRKTVIDGSNTGGFQRTAIVGTNGTLEADGKSIAIPTICVEEESAGIVEERDGASYRLDRLGIPLVEIATDASITGGEQAQHVAQSLGMLMRCFSVQRGIGSIRQDVNVSVEGGSRVEIKGAQELAALRLLVDNEAMRQKKLLEIRDALKKRGAKQPGEAVDVAKVFSGTSSRLLKQGIARKEAILALKLPGFAGMLGVELYAGRRFGTELSDYAKAGRVGGIIHSDEDLAGYGISAEEVASLGKRLGIGESDAFVLVAGSADNAAAAMHYVRQRAEAALAGVPEETRRALAGGASEYMRPLPGSSRLYPETDVPPVRITAVRIAALKKRLPETPEQKRARLMRMLNAELAGKMLGSQRLRLFESIVEEIRVEPTLVASTLEETLVSLSRNGIPVQNLPDEKIFELFGEYAKGLFVKAAIPHLLSHAANNPKAGIAQSVEELRLRRISGAALKARVRDDAKGVPKERLMQVLMSKLRLVADAKEIAEIIKKI